jgi:hypothetical protein
MSEFKRQLVISVLGSLIAAGIIYYGKPVIEKWSPWLSFLWSRFSLSVWQAMLVSIFLILIFRRCLIVISDLQMKYEALLKKYKKATSSDEYSEIDEHLSTLKAIRKNLGENPSGYVNYKMAEMFNDAVRQLERFSDLKSFKYLVDIEDTDDNRGACDALELATKCDSILDQFGEASE